MGLNLTLGYAGPDLAGAGLLHGDRRLHHGAADARRLALGSGACRSALVACFVVGLLLGYPALRVKGHFLAFVTLAFNTLVFLVLRNEDWLTGGSYGLVGMPRPDFGLFTTMKQLHFYYFTLGVIARSPRLPCGASCARPGAAPSRRCAKTRSARKASASTRAASRCSPSPSARPMADLAGALVAPLVQFIEPGIVRAGPLAAHPADGGGRRLRLSSSARSSGRRVVILLPEFLRFTEGYYLIIYSALVIVMMVFVPVRPDRRRGRSSRDRFWPRHEVRADLTEGAQLK